MDLEPQLELPPEVMERHVVPDHRVEQVDLPVTRVLAAPRDPALTRVYQGPTGRVEGRARPPHQMVKTVVADRVMEAADPAATTPRIPTTTAAAAVPAVHMQTQGYSAALRFQRVEALAEATSIGQWVGRARSPLSSGLGRISLASQRVQEPQIRHSPQQA